MHGLIDLFAGFVISVCSSQRILVVLVLLEPMDCRAKQAHRHMAGWGGGLGRWDIYIKSQAYCVGDHRDILEAPVQWISILP